MTTYQDFMLSVRQDVQKMGFDESKKLRHIKNIDRHLSNLNFSQRSRAKRSGDSFLALEIMYRD